MSSAPRGMYWEDFIVGETITTPSRTITSTDIVNFACLSGDFNEVHSNWEYCKSTPFEEPIAHGPLIYAVAAGLQYLSGINDGTFLALLEIDGWRMRVPVKHGDTIHVELEVLGRNETAKPDEGTVNLRRKFMRYDGTLLQQMDVTMLFKRRPQAVAA